MTRKLFIGFVAGALLTLSSMGAMAAPTPEQTKALTDARTKMLETRKELVNAEAAAGLITQDQANAVLKRLDAQLARFQPLSEEQTKALEEIRTKMVETHKEMINALLAAGQISQTQADALLKQLDAQATQSMQPGPKALGMQTPDKVNQGRRVQVFSQLGTARGGMMDGARGGMMDGARGGMMDGAKGGMMDGARGGMMDGARGGMMDGARGGMMDGPQGGMMNGAQGGMMNRAQGGMMNGAQGGMMNGAQGGMMNGPQGGMMNGACPMISGQ